MSTSVASIPVTRTTTPRFSEQLRDSAAFGAVFTDHVLVATEDDRPLDWLPVARLVDLEQVPATAPGGAEPVIDQVTTLRDALSALFEANAAYGPVVDGQGRCVGLIGASEIAAGFRQAAGVATVEVPPPAPATLDAGTGSAGG